MMRFGIIFVGSLCIAAYAQTPDGQPSFDVATIKPAAPPNGGRIRIGMNGGPGTPDPGRYTCNFCNLTMLLTQAYDVKGYQISGPSSMDEGRFEVTAKVPEGATPAQFKLMLQNLLAERFKLTVHHEKKEAQVYELTVAKGGSKMKESEPEPPKDPTKADDAPPPLPPAGRGRPEMGADGFPVLPKAQAGRPMMFMGMGRARMQATAESMEEFAKMLSNQVAKPVTDATGLKGKYDFTLTWDGSRDIFGFGGGLPPPPPPPGGGAGPGAGAAGNTPLAGASDAETHPTIFAAVQSQLGLKLEQKKGQIETIVIDHVEKVPTEN
jgi:uncharacterized protein (TIGR03435 family)